MNDVYQALYEYIDDAGMRNEILGGGPLPANNKMASGIEELYEEDYDFYTGGDETGSKEKTEALLKSIFTEEALSNVMVDDEGEVHSKKELTKTGLFEFVNENEDKSGGGLYEFVEK